MCTHLLFVLYLCVCTFVLLFLPYLCYICSQRCDTRGYGELPSTGNACLTLKETSVSIGGWFLRYCCFCSQICICICVCICICFCILYVFVFVHLSTGNQCLNWRPISPILLSTKKIPFIPNGKGGSQITVNLTNIVILEGNIFRERKYRWLEKKLSAWQRERRSVSGE